MEEKKLEIKDNLVYIKARAGKAGSPVSEIENMIRRSEKPRKLKTWVNKLSRKSSRFRKSIEADLVRKKLIRIEKKKFLGIIPYQNTYLTGRRERNDFINQLREGLTRKRELEENRLGD